MACISCAFPIAPCTQGGSRDQVIVDCFGGGTQQGSQLGDVEFYSTMTATWFPHKSTELFAYQTTIVQAEHKLKVGFISGFRSSGGGGGQMLSTKIKGGSGLSTNYIIRCTKNHKGGDGN